LNVPLTQLSLTDSTTKSRWTGKGPVNPQDPGLISEQAGRLVFVLFMAMI
jgi:hypothetical protein